MLDDLLELGLELAGDGAQALLGGPKDGKKRGRAPARRPARPARERQEAPAVPAGKVTAQREKRGEDPWEWKEKRPPWEG